MLTHLILTPTVLRLIAQGCLLSLRINFERGLRVLVGPEGWGAGETFFVEAMVDEMRNVAMRAALSETLE